MGFGISECSTPYRGQRTPDAGSRSRDQQRILRAFCLKRQELPMRARSTIAPATLAWVFAACASSGPSADDLNTDLAVSGSDGATTDTGSTSTVTSGAANVTSTGTTGGMTSAGMTSTTGTGGAGTMGSTGNTMAGPTSATNTTGDSTNTVTTTTGNGGAMSTTETVSTDGGGTGGTGPAGPYDPRSGTFNMLVYSRVGVGAFRHDSISTGQGMLQDIADEWGFSVTITETNELITAEGLAQFEAVFFM